MEETIDTLKLRLEKAKEVFKEMKKANTKLEDENNSLRERYDEKVDVISQLEEQLLSERTNTECLNRAMEDYKAKYENCIAKFEDATTAMLKMYNDAIEMTDTGKKYANNVDDQEPQE